MNRLTVNKKDYTCRLGFPFPNPSRMTVKIKRMKHEPIRPKKKIGQQIIDYLNL